ncbi:MAG TPA: type II toxin-antitoxin system HicA family toxin [Dehalococcoidia bacterium]|jgi:predicted RNA binding protein YcfA (HicA-like mRNA interferase family)
MRALSRRELVRRLRHFGFDGPIGGGNHEYVKKGGLKVTVPNPHGSVYSVALVSRIVRQAHIDPETWDELDRA